MSRRHSPEALPELLAVAIAGRFVLSLLPPGSVGSHRPRDWPVTWAASHALGAPVFGLAGSLISRWNLSPAWFIALGALAIGARILTLPAAMVPRHDPPSERPDWLARLFGVGIVITVLLACIGQLRQPTEVGTFQAATWVALLILIGHGFERARRAPSGRRCVLLLVAWLAYSLQSSTRADEWLLALFFGSGCAFIIPWLRRADRRALALSTLSFAACIPWPLNGWPLMLAGLGSLIPWTSRPSRLAAARASALALTCIGLPWLLAGWPRGRSWFPTERGFELGPAESGWGLGRTLASIALALGLVACVRSRSKARNARGIDAPRRELAALLSILTIALIVKPSLGAESWQAEWGLMFVAPCAVLIIGLSLVRSERPA